MKRVNVATPADLDEQDVELRTLQPSERAGRAELIVRAAQPCRTRLVRAPDLPMGRLYMDVVLLARSALGLGSGQVCRVCHAPLVCLGGRLLGLLMRQLRSP